MPKTSTWNGLEEKFLALLTYSLSNGGWIDTELFKQWFFQHFLCHAGSSRPLLLLLDGHSSHFNLDLVTMARDNDVVIYTLGPHTTHEMQLLDVAVFGPLKHTWQEICHNLFNHAQVELLLSINSMKYFPMLG